MWFPVPFSLVFQIFPWGERVLRVRHNLLAAYGFALVMVALAVLIRGLVGEYANVQVFTPFYPAIILATLVGGLWPGIFATLLSAVAAWYLVIPQFFSSKTGQRELVEFVLFTLISGVDVTIAVVLSRLVERLVLQQRNIRVLLASAPTAVVLGEERDPDKMVT